MRTVSLRTLVQALLLLAYPVCCHFAVTLDNPQLQLWALVLLGFGLTFKGLASGNRLAWGVMVFMLGLAFVMDFLALSRWVLFLPPVLLPLLMWSVFHRSLEPGQTPLVTHIATIVRGTLPPELVDYTRAVTRVWSLFFGGLALYSAALPFIASPAIWSLCTNLINWLLIAALFIAEFLHRRSRFSDLEHISFWQYLQTVIRADIRSIG